MENIEEKERARRILLQRKSTLESEIRALDVAINSLYKDIKLYYKTLRTKSCNERGDSNDIN